MIEHLVENMNINKIREDFPIITNSKVVYFDNACMSFKPKQVINAINEYYTNYGSCAGRSYHKLGKITEEKFEEARNKIAKFIGSKKEEIVFTKNTTEAINLVANVIDFSDKKKVVTSNMEHHSAILPFQQLSGKGKINLDFVVADDKGEMTGDMWAEKIDKNTKLVVAHHTTNSIGTAAPLNEITKIAHEVGALILVDGAQGAPHSEINFKKSNFDFFAFSGHKMLGPTGTGCLAAKLDLLNKLPPFLVGGETIEKVTLDSATFTKPPHKFEAGLQHYSGFIGLGTAVDYLSKIGMKEVKKHEIELARYLLEGLKEIEGVIIYGLSDPKRKNCGIVTFNIKNIPPHQVSIMLDEMEKIATRSGVFCAEPAMNHLGAPNGAVRASFYLYNTKDEVDVFINSIKKISVISYK